MEQIEWVLVPKKATQAMIAAGVHAGRDCVGGYADYYSAMIAAAPEPPHITMTQEEAQQFQCWNGMDGATADHLIDRHASGWGETARMMDAWRKANTANDALVNELLTTRERLIGSIAARDKLLRHWESEVTRLRDEGGLVVKGAISSVVNKQIYDFCDFKRSPPAPVSEWDEK